MDRFHKGFWDWFSKELEPYIRYQKPHGWNEGRNSDYYPIKWIDITLLRRFYQIYIPKETKSFELEKTAWVSEKVMANIAGKKFGRTKIYGVKNLADACDGLWIIDLILETPPKDTLGGVNNNNKDT